MILVLTEEFAIDLGICFTLRKTVPLLFVTTYLLTYSMVQSRS